MLASGTSAKMSLSQRVALALTVERRQRGAASLRPHQLYVFSIDNPETHPATLCVRNGDRTIAIVAWLR